MLGSLKSFHILLGITATGMTCVTILLLLDKDGLKEKEDAFAVKHKIGILNLNFSDPLWEML